MHSKEERTGKSGLDSVTCGTHGKEAVGGRASTTLLNNVAGEGNFNAGCVLVLVTMLASFQQSCQGRRP